MVPSTAPVEPLPLHGAPFTRSDSIASSVRSTSSNLKRRSRTRTRSLAPEKRGRSLGHPVGSSKYDSDAGESFLDFDDVPPVPTLVRDEPEEMPSNEQREVKQARRRSRSVGPAGVPTFQGLHPGMPQISRSWSALDVRNLSLEQSRGRQAKSDNGSVKGAKSRLRGLSLPRHPFRQNSPSDCSSQPSPQTPHGFGEPPLPIAGSSMRNPRDSVMTHVSSTSSSVYPASTSAGTRTESSMPYTDDQDEAYMSYPDIVLPEHPDFDPDDVSYRLRLLLNNNYFLPPAHAKPTPLSLNPSDPAKKNKPTNGGFLDFFRIGKTKSKPATPVTGSPPPVDSNGPILRTTSDTPTASGLLLRAPPQPLVSPTVAKPLPPPASRVVVLRERMEDLATAAKESEKELRSKADTRKTKSHTTPRDRFLDDVIDPTDAVDLPPPSANSIFAVQTSAVYGLGPEDSVGAAVLADRLVPGSPGIWSTSSQEDTWRKQLLQEAVSHSLDNTPDHSFSSSISSSEARLPILPPAQSEASFPMRSMMGAERPRIGQRILEDLSVHTASALSDQSPPVSPASPSEQFLFRSGSLLSDSHKAIGHPILSASGPPARAETPAHMPLPLQPPPRKPLMNPLYSLSQPDLPEVARRAVDSTPQSSSISYHTVRKASSTPGLSGAEEVAVQRTMVSLSPPPLPQYQGSKRGISPDSRGPEGMPSFSTTRSRTDSEPRYSSDSMSFRTPMDTDVDQDGGRPSISLSIPSGRPSFVVSVSEYSMPSPTASAFRDAVFGSCRPPSALSRRSVASHTEPLPQAHVRQPPPTPRSVVTSPPPRMSTTVSPTELPVPPRPPAARPTYRPSTSTMNSRSSSSRGRPSLGSPAASEIAPVQDASVTLSFPSSSSSPAPLSARRGFGSPLLLTIPDRFQPPVIHSAPAPASPTDFFDRMQSTIHNAMDDLDTSDESDSDEEVSLGTNARSRFNHAPPGGSPSTLRSQPRSVTSPVEHFETAHVFIEPRTQAISNRSSSSSARPSIMRLGNHSTPQLSQMSAFTTQEPFPQFTYDRKKPIGNVVDRGGRLSFSSHSKKAKNAPRVPLLPIGVLPSSPTAPGAPIARASLSSASSAALGGAKRLDGAVDGKRRPATATGAEAREQERQKEKGKGKGRAGATLNASAGGRQIQRESIQRFDGMLVQHLAAERDRMKRITNDYLSSSTTSSPVQQRPPTQLQSSMPS